MARQADRTAATTRLILDTARGLFAAQGDEAVSIDMIAAAAGLTKGAITTSPPSETCSSA